MVITSTFLIGVQIPPCLCEQQPQTQYNTCILHFLHMVHGIFFFALTNQEELVGITTSPFHVGPWHPFAWWACWYIPQTCMRNGLCQLCLFLCCQFGFVCLLGFLWCSAGRLLAASSSGWLRLGVNIGVVMSDAMCAAGVSAFSSCDCFNPFLLDGSLQKIINICIGLKVRSCRWLWW